jgi:hypothetical protein
MIKRLILLLSLFLLPITFWGQGHTFFSDEDPAFNYIQTYLPEYYYEEDIVGGSAGSLEFTVRTLYNYVDDKTFSYYILKHGTEWGCLEIDEIDSIITYLERVSDRSSFPSKTATLVYNTRRGFMFEAVQTGMITLYFPKNGPKCENRFPTSWIKALKKGKEYVKYDTQFVSWTDAPDENHESYAITAVARVRFRSVVGALPKPKSVGSGNGKVVVQIEVDQYGNVVSAVPGAEGTTIMDEEQWNAARTAAMRAHFNMSANAPTVQTGTIVYTFN